MNNVTVPIFEKVDATDLSLWTDTLGSPRSSFDLGKTIIDEVDITLISNNQWHVHSKHQSLPHQRSKTATNKILINSHCWKTNKHYTYNKEGNS